jgi:two-component system cell cycle sensor histidine kinase/response regulator CckA
METLPANAATILLVEDDEFVREVAVEILQRAGFVILKARNAAEAAELYQQSHGKIDLLVSDVVMPGKTGPELGAELRAQRPELKIMLMSGYGESSPEGNAADEEGFFYLPKPFSVRTLVDKINEALGRTVGRFAVGAG